MKESLDKILPKITPYVGRLYKYKILIFFLLIFSVYGFLVYKINDYNSQEPSEDEITAKLQAVPLPRIDEDTANKLNQLQDNSSSVRSLFNDARQNPFRE